MRGHVADMTHRIFSDHYDRLFVQMVAVSVAAHIFAFAAIIILPELLPQSSRNFPEVIEIDLAALKLPKGAGLGTELPDQNREAVRRSDPRKMQEIVDERRQERDADTVRPTDRRKVETKRLGWRDQQAIQDAIDRVRDEQRKKRIMESQGGGGTGDVNTSGILSNYIALVRSQIMRVWSLPGGLPREYLQRTINVRIFVAPSGKIVKKLLVRPSNFEPLDRSCLSAVVKASPLQAPPALLREKLQNEGILIRFHPREKSN